MKRIGFINSYYGEVPIIRKFKCKHCEQSVEVDNPKDKRVKYCSSQCEKEYWRQLTKHKKRDIMRKLSKINNA